MYNNFDDLPLILSVRDVADILQISLTNAYQLFHSDAFPSLSVGKRLMVYREAFVKYLEAPPKN